MGFLYHKKHNVLLSCSIPNIRIICLQRTNAARIYFFLQNSDILIVWKEHRRIVIHILNFDLYLGRIECIAIISPHSQCVTSYVLIVQWRVDTNSASQIFNHESIICVSIHNAVSHNRCCIIIQSFHFCDLRIDIGVFSYCLRNIYSLCKAWCIVIFVSYFNTKYLLTNVVTAICVQC